MRLLYSVFLVLNFFSAIHAQTKPLDFVELEKVIEAELKRKKNAGRGNRRRFRRQSYFCERLRRDERGKRCQRGNADTLFRMGSTTKMFTAAALISLANAGKIKLDAPIGNYVKNLPPKIAALTAHQILSQSSGLRDFAPTVFSNDDAALGQNIRLWKDDVFFTDPNKIYSYSSANYWFAGFLTEELTGKSYADSLGELVFKPLGMTRSTIRPTEAMTYPLALGHDVKESERSRDSPD